MSNRIRRSLSLVAAAAFLLGLSATAFAQDKPAKPDKPARVKVITIEEENVEGDVPTGQIIPVDARAFSKHPSLIRIRYSFVDKILGSAESI